MAETTPGLKIDGRFYEFPSSYTLGEARVLKQLTGLTLAEFGRALEIPDEDAEPDKDGNKPSKVLSDPDYLTFLIWVAIHRENPKVTVEDVERLDLNVAFEGFTGPDKDDAGPPEQVGSEETAGETEQATSSSPSQTSADRSETASEPSPATRQATSGRSG